MERINVGTEQRLIVGVNRFVSFFDGEALVGAGKAGITGKIQSAFGAEACSQTISDELSPMIL